MYKLIKKEEDFIVISKDPDVNFHKEEQEVEGLMDKLRLDLNLKELYAVHRLDKVTSGLLVFARNRAIAAELSEQFRNGLTEKYYLAISDQKPQKKQGLIKGDMVKARRGAWKLTKTTNNPAITQFFSISIEEGLRLFLIKIHTGKTHQIRVAMKSIGSPVLGDPLYHKKNFKDGVVDRSYLHAYCISFQVGKSKFRFVDKPVIGTFFKGKRFEEALVKFAKPWEVIWPSVVK